MNWTVAFDGGVWGALLAAGAGGLLFWGWRAGRELPGPVRRLRAVALLLFAGAALKPSVERLEARAAKPRLAIVVDNGLAMAAKDGGPTTRVERAAAWLAARRKAIEARAEPVFYAASDHARRITWEELAALKPSAADFDLGSSLQDAADGQPASRLWLFSDGVSEAGEEPGAALARWRRPVDALGVGPRRTARSVSLADLKTPDFVFLHSRFNVGVAVEASELAGGSAIVRLWKGAALASEQKLPVRGAFEVLSATMTAEATSLGQERYRLELLGAPADGSKAIQAVREFGVEVIRQKYRIMYLAGRPSFEYSHLREQLKADPNHELVSFVILRNPENVSPVADHELSLIPFPAQEIFVQNLMQFDLFILENFAYWRFNLPVAYLEGLKRFVSQGGGLLLIGGSNAFTKGGYHNTPLEETLPVGLWQTPDDYAPGLFRPKVSAADNPLARLGDNAEASAALWDALPPLDGFNRFAAVRPGATVLLAHPTEKAGSGAPLPVISVREYGKGKVMVIGTDSTWRWKLGSAADWRASSFYVRFWTKAVQYLTGSLDLKKVKFSPLPDRLPPREPATLALHVFDDSFRPLSGAEADVRVTWTSPDGRSRPAPLQERSPGVFRIELTGLDEGEHRLHAVARHRGQLWGEDKARFDWQPRPPEAPLNRKWLKELSDRADGRYADLERAPVDDWLAQLPPVRSEPEVLSRWAVWNSSAWLWALAALLLLEWFLRRRLGFA